MRRSPYTLSHFSQISPSSRILLWAWGPDSPALAGGSPQHRECIVVDPRKSSIRRDEEGASGPTRRLVGEIQQTANQVRDLSIGIEWTEAVNNLLSLPIKGHRLKIESHFRLANIFEKVDRERADELWRSAVNDSKVVEAATWLVDLQVPAAEEPVEEPNKEVD